MKLLLIFIIFTLILTCSNRRSENDEVITRDFNDLNQDDKRKLAGELGRELKGDYRKFTGQANFKDKTGIMSSDSSTFIELVLDEDHRFAIRTKYLETRVKTDSTEWFSMGGVFNKGIGRWSDKGDKIELHFLLGSADNFFDKNENKGTIRTINEKTATLHKSADELWIWKTLCKRAN